MVSTVDCTISTAACGVLAAVEAAMPTLQFICTENPKCSNNQMYRTLLIVDTEDEWYKEEVAAVEGSLQTR